MTRGLRQGRLHRHGGLGALLFVALLLGCGERGGGPVDPTLTPPGADETVRPYVASPEPARTVTSRRGGASVDPDPVKLYFRSCADVPESMKPLRRGEPGYRKELDRDRDGFACEQV